MEHCLRIAKICQLKKGERKDRKRQQQFSSEKNSKKKTLVKVCKFSVDTFFNFPKKLKDISKERFAFRMPILCDKN
jgi:hypothetical protein